MMLSFYHSFFFGIFPYIALCSLAIGSFIRYEREQYSWQASSSQILADKGLMLGNVLFHIGVIFIFFGHFAGLLTPHFIYEKVISAEHKQLLAIIAGGVAGVLCFAGLTILVVRRLFVERIRATSSFADILILVLLWMQVSLGLISIPFSLSHHDAGQMLALSEWAQHILTFRGGAANYIVGTDFVFQMHLILGLSIFLVFPFTRLVHMLSAPLKYFVRPYQIVRSREARR
ncbi:MAG: Respiratory nitrate reductase gamma subunit [Hyphomonadaceae bacterium]|nr:MAG: Respiratory nitrate reductase gamma subunit [Hyphomonadaceae bacterium]KAF0186817.1 MAG: Respiratory nitrate reductase gamma subunit [Hyphomonadaceae bacterium]